MLSGLLTVLVAVGAGLLVLGVLILVHELGHFVAAKSVGIAVVRFSFGLGPRTPLAFTWGETEYCLSWVPFGGYVKMAGLEEEGTPGGIEGPKQEVVVPKERTFDAQPLWARVLVIGAGVLMNALFAVLLYTVLAAAYGVALDPTVTVGEVQSTGLPMGAAALATLRPGDRIVRINGDTMTDWGDIQGALLKTGETPIRIEVAGRAQPVLIDVPRVEQRARIQVLSALTPWHDPVIGDVVAGRPAAGAGFRQGDRILKVGGDTIPSWERFVRAVEESPGRPIEVTIARSGARLVLHVTPRASQVRDSDEARPRTVGRIGVAPLLPVRRFGPLGALGQGLRQAGEAGGLVLFTLKGLLLGQLSLRDIGGPILVSQLSGEVVRLGIEPFLSFIALFSMNLAVLNLLPIPILDGGHLAFLLVEGVRGRPLSLEQRHRLTQIGFFVLVGIMLLAVANDVVRLIPR